ncbi:MAG: homoserine dehydrogenase [Heliobacteriaceae bacterium]|jgi:homoserine dehydrogenase|nr:homoserine dehydrogenase [Heliobacteriaceae bacterium]
MSAKRVKIGLIGLGTVGSGVYRTLKAFEHIEIAKIAVRDKNKPRNIPDLDQSILTENPLEVVNNPEIEIVIELIGGIEPAFGLIQTAVENGKHIVTANKELLAKHGEELFNIAEKHNRVILYEAAIAGGIPIIMPIKTILTGNNITKIEAILNGTTNYILTKMDLQGLSYEEALKEAQELGYAEADPASDVEGFDAAYKITTLATLAFKERVKLDKVYREGITKINAQDMKIANELGYKIKLTASAYFDENNNADVRVHPMLIPKQNTLAHIDYVTNAVSLTGHPIGEITLSGPGAGAFPTASSVTGDVLAIAAEIGTTDYLLPQMRCRHRKTANVINILDTENRYYLLIEAANVKGVTGKIGAICAENNISLKSFIQKDISENNTAAIVIITEKAVERDMLNAISEFKKDESIINVNNLIRVQLY